LKGSTRGNNLPARIPEKQLLDAVLLMSPLCCAVVVRGAAASTQKGRDRHAR